MPECSTLASEATAAHLERCRASSSHAACVCVQVMPHTTNSSSNKDTDVTKSNSAGSSDSNPHAAAAAAITAAQNSSNASGSGCQPTARPLPPLPPAKPAGDGSSNASSSGNSRASAGGGSSDKRCGVGSVGNPQLQLVQRLPSLTGATPRLVHKVETWLVQVRAVAKHTYPLSFCVLTQNCRPLAFESRNLLPRCTMRNCFARDDTSHHPNDSSTAAAAILLLPPAGVLRLRHAGGCCG